MSNTALQTASRQQTAIGGEWWRGAAIYQIYPRSFADSNNDGVGDLPGVTSKLDYVASLGVDGVWLSPFFTSPMADFGYDVADYRNVDPIFGTLADFDALVARAHALGLKVIIDQVYCHTSDKHDWFNESRRDRENDKADWYVWADAKQDGAPPNNWPSVFGGPAWTWDARRRQFFLHHFLKQQPTLNLHNPRVVDALISVGKFWIDRGVDGFRLDALNVGMQDERLRDNPASSRSAEALRPYDMQDHIYSHSHPKMTGVVEQFANAFRDHGGEEFFTVAEIGGGDPHPVMKEYTKGGDRLSSAYCFDLIGVASVTGDYLRYALSQWPNAIDEGYPAWALSNHDCRRVASRWAIGDDDAANARLFALLHAAFRGATFIYQGEELGLPQADIPFDRLVDPEGIANWPASQGRDGARTPMPWRATEINAGFSKTDPWLPVSDAHRTLAVDAQDADENSTLSFYRSVLAMRRQSDALRLGDLEILETPENILAVKKSHNGDEWLCAFNLSQDEVNWSPPASGEFAVALAANLHNNPERAPSNLPPLAGYIAHKKTIP